MLSLLLPWCVVKMQVFLYSVYICIKIYCVSMYSYVSIFVFCYLGRIKYLTMTDSRKVWMPDTFFRNEKHGQFHRIIQPNLYIRVFPEGDILYSIRWILNFCFLHNVVDGPLWQRYVWQGAQSVTFNIVCRCFENL